MSSNKKNDISPEDEALQKRVDAMMDVSATKEESPSEGKPVPQAPNASPQEPIDIFAEARTAPEVSSDLLKQIGVPTEKAPAESASEAAPATDAAAPETMTDEVQAGDTETDKAVDEIVAQEGEQDAADTEEPPAPKRHVNPAVAQTQGTDWKHKLRTVLKSKWTWLAVVLLIIGLFVLPVTRYKLLGLVIKKSVTVSVLDSKTATPVSSAEVALGGATGKTNASGKAVLKAGVGNQHLKISKKYYRDYNSTLFVNFNGSKAAAVSMVATGRQVPITVLNKLTGKPLAGAEINVAGTSAKTDSRGKAVVVLPTSSSSDMAKVTHSGFNVLSAPVQVTSLVVAQNTFRLTPAGHIYFLSNLNGTIDVVKADLDGANRHVVLEGTGKEDKRTTALLASRDWRYLVLKARRDTAQPALYLIDTSNDKVASFDDGDSDFTLVGWHNHNFIYDIVRNTVPQSQAGHEQLKSYNADRGELNQLDQTQAEGSSTSYAYQGFSNFYILNGLVAYNTQWFTYDTTGAGYDLSSKTNTIRAAQPGGQGKKDYQSFPAANTTYFQAVLYEPQAIYYSAYNNADNKTTYYKFEDGSVATDNTLTQDSFTQQYPTYLISPSGNQTFWTELRDGKNTLFVGDSNGQKKKQVASLSDYAPYGWFSDNYLLVSKNGSELYALPVDGLTGSQQPVKITDYYKPAQTFAGYGYGYGGL